MIDRIELWTSDQIIDNAFIDSCGESLKEG